VSELIGGIFFPIPIAVIGFIYLVSRMAYHVLYSKAVSLIKWPAMFMIIIQSVLPWLAFSACMNLMYNNPYKRNSKLMSGLNTGLHDMDPFKK